MSARSGHCPCCGSDILQRWGGTPKIVMDTEQSVAFLQRYHCNNCDYTFRVYPMGVDRSPLSYRVHRLAAIAWALGMSSRDVAAYFDQLDSHFIPRVSSRLGVVIALDLGAGRISVNSARKVLIEQEIVNVE